VVEKLLHNFVGKEEEEKRRKQREDL